MKQEDDEENAIIPLPEPFFRTFEEGLNKDIANIKGYYSKITTTSNFILPDRIKSKNIILNTKINRNIATARQTILLYMLYQPEYSIFNLPPPISILKTTQIEPKKLYDQEFTHFFKNIRKKFSLFAKIIRKYFSHIIDHLFCFSWSTFPSTYNFFVSDYFIEDGYNLIMQFLPSTSTIDITISDSLLPPFFLCSFEFLTKFWFKISSGIFDRIQFRSNLVYFFINSIYSCSSFLSSYHKSIILELNSIDSNRCINFLIKNFIKISFEIASQNNEFLFTTEEIEYIKNFLNNYPKFINSEICEDFIEAFTFNFEKAEKIESIEKVMKIEKENQISIGFPKMPNHAGFDQFQLFISMYDIGIFLEILDFSEDDQELKKSCISTIFRRNKEKYFQQGFVLFEITELNAKVKKIERKKIFPIECENYWSSLLSRSKEENTNPFELFKNSINNSTFSDSEKFEKFMYLNQIHIYEEKFEILKRLLAMQTRIKENEILFDSIQLFLKPLINGSFEKIMKNEFKIFLNQIKVPSNQIGLEMARLILLVSNKKELKYFPSFQKLCTFLNTFEIERDRIYLKLTNNFLNVIKNERKKILNSMLSCRKAKRVLDSLCANFDNKKNDKRIGQIIIGIFQLIEYTIEIDSILYGNNFRFKLLFKYVLCVLNSSESFDAFLILKIVSKKNKNLFESFDEKSKNYFHLFCDVMNEFLRNYKQDLRCLSYVRSCY